MNVLEHRNLRDLPAGSKTSFFACKFPITIKTMDWRIGVRDGMSELDVLRTVVGISVLVFFAKILAGVVSRFSIPEVIGEITAGIILGPAALGGVIHVFGGPLIELNELLKAFAQIGGIIILFAAGLESSFAQFRAAGSPSFAVAAMGVVVPFVLGYYVPIQLGYEWQVAMLFGAALTATSIAITIRSLENIRQLHTEEARIMINAAVIDDVLGLAVLAIVISIFQAGSIPSYFTIAQTTIIALGLWLGLLIGAVFVLPRFLNITSLWKSEGTAEAAATASCFGFAGLAAALGLSPIVGAFAAGMAIASSKAIGRIKEYIEKLKFIFAPLFFAVIGTYLNFGSARNINFVVFSAVLTVAVVSKVVGCGLPAALFLRDPDRGLRVGIGMVSRGEVGFIIAGIGVATGVLSGDAYAALLTVIIAADILTPFLLRRAFSAPILKGRLYGLRGHKS